MTCDATIQIVRHGASSDSPRLTDSQSQSGPCGHAVSIENGRENDGLRNIIERRAGRLTFNNSVQRRRYIETQMALATYSEGN